MDVIPRSRMEVIMRIDRSDSADKITTIRAAGRLDTVTSPEFRAVVADVPQDVTRGDGLDSPNQNRIFG